MACRSRLARASRVARLLDRASGPAPRLVAALVAIHAVPDSDLVRLQTADLDLGSRQRVAVAQQLADDLRIDNGPARGHAVQRTGELLDVG